MRKIVFDIESKNFSNNLDEVEISLVAIHDSESDQYSTYLEDELHKLWPILEHSDMLIGFSSETFDIPVLNRYYPGNLTQIKSLDILKEIKTQYGRRMKLDQIAEGTLGRNKSAWGVEAVKWWRNGEIEKIRQYCIEDVKITKEIYDYARANNKLIFKEGKDMKEIKLNTDDWENKADSKLTFSLPF